MNNKVMGAGLGLRSQHIPSILSEKPTVPWFEVLTDNYLNHGVIPHENLKKIRELYPVVFHGVGMNLGSSRPLNKSYLNRLSELILEYQPFWISDHLCWIGTDGVYANDLLPLPFTKTTLEHVVQKIDQAQTQLGRQILIENISSYVCLAESDFTEWDFLVEVAKKSGCRILLDINNIFVNSVNLGFDAIHYIDCIPKHLIGQIHLAGHETVDSHLVDTHGAAICPEVFELFKYAIRQKGQIPALIERDRNIPEFPVLFQEMLTVQHILEGVIHDTGSNTEAVS